MDVEIDGATHAQLRVKEKDAIRDRYVLDNGWEVLRISAKELKNNKHECVNKVLDRINESLIEIPIYYKNAKSLKDIKMLERNNEYNLKIKQKQDAINLIIERLYESTIDFSKFGWVSFAYKIIGCKPQKVNKWMKTYMSDFYESVCFKRKRHNV